MNKSLLTRFAARWLVSSLGLYVATLILGKGNFSVGSNVLPQILIAGLILSLVNMALKPLLIILSLPALILSLGLFMLVVNGLVILIVSWLDSAMYVKNFGIAVVVGIILGLVNLLVTTLSKEIA